MHYAASLGRINRPDHRELPTFGKTLFTRNDCMIALVKIFKVIPQQACQYIQFFAAHLLRAKEGPLTDPVFQLLESL